ncbi:MAG: DUF4358 domain-containing protein [Peptostreptococcaceae bacterium]
MKKLFLVLSLVLSIGLVGCSSKDNGYKNVSSSDIEKAILSSKLLVEEPMSGDVKEFDYFNDVNEQIAEGFISRAAMNVRLEDVIFIKTENEEDASTVLTSLESYKENTIMRGFGDGYGGEENATRASNTILEQKGNYVYLISAQNAKDIENVIIDKIQN